MNKDFPRTDVEMESMLLRYKNHQIADQRKVIESMKKELAEKDRYIRELEGRTFHKGQEIYP